MRYTRYKISKDGEVVNTILADPDFIEGYCAENGFTYEEEVLPEAPTPQPTAQDDTDAMLIDHEYRLALLELGIV